MIDLITKRKNITHQKSEGLNLTIYLINEHRDRTFRFKGLKNKQSNVRGEELLALLQDEIQSTLILYRYITKVKTYTDRKGIFQMEISLLGKASMMSRYNPMDIEIKIKMQ